MEESAAKLALLFEAQRHEQYAKRCREEAEAWRYRLGKTTARQFNRFVKQLRREADL